MRVLFLCLRIACTLACSFFSDRDVMFKQLAATADPNKLHAVIEELVAPKYPNNYINNNVLRSVQVTVDLSAGTLALGHLVSGGVGDVGLHMVPVTSKYSFSMNDKTGVATVIEIGKSTTVASFDDAVGSVVAWFVSEALGLVYLVSGEKRVLMAPLGCGTNCSTTVQEFPGPTDISGGPALVDDAQQIVKLPAQCCRCVTHDWFVFDEAHDVDGRTNAASFAVDTRSSVIHVAGQMWRIFGYSYGEADEFTSATITTTSTTGAVEKTLTFPATVLLALLPPPLSPPPPPPLPPTPSPSSPLPPCTVDPNPACSKEKVPVCGANGITYDNKCLAEAACQLEGSTPGECCKDKKPKRKCKVNKCNKRKVFEKKCQATCVAHCLEDPEDKKCPKDKQHKKCSPPDGKVDCTDKKTRKKCPLSCPVCVLPKPSKVPESPKAPAGSDSTKYCYTKEVWSDAKSKWCCYDQQLPRGCN